MKFGIEIGINIIVLTTLNIEVEMFTLLFIRLHFTVSLSSHPSSPLLPMEDYLISSIKTLSKNNLIAQFSSFIHLDLVSYQDQLRNPK